MNVADWIRKSSMLLPGSVAPRERRGQDHAGQAG